MTVQAPPGGRLRVGLLAEYPWTEEQVNRGGVVQANFRLAQALALSEDIDLVVFAPTDRIREEVQRPLGRGRIVFYPQPPHDVRYGFVPTTRLLRRLVKQYAIDLLHVQAHPQLIVAALRQPTPCVTTIHGIWRNELRVSYANPSPMRRIHIAWTNVVERWYLPRLRNVIAITDEIASLVREMSPRARIVRLHNPIDQRFFSLNDTSSQPTVLQVGWVSHRKGVHVLLKAAEELAGRMPGLRVRVAGARDHDPAFVAQLESEFRRAIALGRVVFTGPISQESLYDEMSRCRLFCLPSLAESAPLVISQAMAAAKPVVASRVGGIPQMVEDGVTGRLCQPGDPGSLAAALASLLDDPVTARAMGARGRQRAEERHSFSSVASKTIQVYRDVLASRVA